MKEAIDFSRHFKREDFFFNIYIAAPLRVSGLGSAALGPVGFRGHSKGEESGGWVGIRKEAVSSRVMSAAVAAT